MQRKTVSLIWKAKSVSRKIRWSQEDSATNFTTWLKIITIDGNSGRIHDGKLPVISAGPVLVCKWVWPQVILAAKTKLLMQKEYQTIWNWANSYRSRWDRQRSHQPNAPQQRVPLDESRKYRRHREGLRNSPNRLRFDSCFLWRELLWASKTN